MAKKKKFKPIQFKVEVDGKNKVFEIIKPTAIVPGYGKFTAAQLVGDNTRANEALAVIVSKNSGVIREVISGKKEAKSSEKAKAEKEAAAKAKAEEEAAAKAKAEEEAAAKANKETGDPAKKGGE